MAKAGRIEGSGGIAWTPRLRAAVRAQLKRGFHRKAVASALGITIKALWRALDESNLPKWRDEEELLRIINGL